MARRSPTPTSPLAAPSPHKQISTTNHRTIGRVLGLCGCEHELGRLRLGHHRTRRRRTRWSRRRPPPRSWFRIRRLPPRRCAHIHCQPPDDPAATSTDPATTSLDPTTRMPDLSPEIARTREGEGAHSSTQAQPRSPPPSSRSRGLPATCSSGGEAREGGAQGWWRRDEFAVRVAPDESDTGAGLSEVSKQLMCPSLTYLYLFFYLLHSLLVCTTF